MSSLSGMRTDRELLADYAATGSETAFSEIVSRHGRMVFRSCLRLLGNEHDAEEAAQTVFLVLMRRRRDLRSEGELAAWLHGVARNAAHVALRGRARRSRHEEAAAMASATGTEEQEAGGESGAAETLALLDAELGRLPAALRQAVVLRYAEGRSVEESARIAGCPPGTLGWRANEGLSRLRRRLGRRGAVVSAVALAGLLTGEAKAAVPASLLPSILGASELAAAGAAAGASGGAAAVLAEGVIKMMFWAKVKTVAAMVAAALAVGGGGGAMVATIMAAEKPPEGGEVVRGLRARLATDKTVYAPGEAITFQLTLENASDKAMTLNAYMMNFWRLKWTFTGNVQQSTMFVEFSLAAPTDKDFPKIGPGESKTFGFKAEGNPPGLQHSPPITTTRFAGQGKFGASLTYSAKDQDGFNGPLENLWTGEAQSNEVSFTIGKAEVKPAAAEAVDGLRFTVSADKLEANAGDAINFDASFENVSKEDFRILRYWGQIGWELAAPNGESLAMGLTAMPGLAPPTEKDFPEIKAGDKISWREKTLSGNPPSMYVGPGINPRNVLLLKPGTYKLTALYTLADGTGKDVAPGKIWAGTVRSNTLEIKLGGQFNAPADPGKWPAAGIPGVTPPQKGEKASAP